MGKVNKKKNREVGGQILSKGRRRERRGIMREEKRSGRPSKLMKKTSK